MENKFYLDKDPSLSNDLLAKLNQVQVDMNDLSKFEEQTIAGIPEGTQVAICTLGNSIGNDKTYF